jgi:TRAP-type C4-dicarboxylate transport system substrate-binding protein
VIGLLVVAGCRGVTKSGFTTPASSQGTITLTFASGDPLPVDTTFATEVDQLSGGHLKLHAEYFDARSAGVDETIAADLKKGTLDVADVASRAWESLGVETFRAYQVPFLVTSRELLDRAVTGPVANAMLASLKPIGVTGLAIVPLGIRYLYSTRPLSTLAQFAGARIRIPVSATTSEVLSQLGATPVMTRGGGGPQDLQGLRDGKLTAVEFDPEHADSGIVQVAPYVVVNAPLLAKTSTFAINSVALRRLPATDAGWLRKAAEQAAASVAYSSADRVAWASLCAQGLKPLALTVSQFNALHNAEAPTYYDLSSDPATALAIDRIGGLAASTPRMDPWATCRGVGVTSSPTAALDGSYGITITQGEVVASGDCANCGNAGPYRLVIDHSRYALYHPVWLHADATEQSVADMKLWGPGDANEVGAVFISGHRVTFVPETSQINGSVPQTFTFELFRGLLTWHLLAGGTGWDTARPWRKLS